MRKNKHNQLTRLLSLRHRHRLIQSPIGSSPDTLTSSPNAGDTTGQIWFINGDSIERNDLSELENIQDKINSRTSDTLIWLDVKGLKESELISTWAQIFNIHPLVISDIVNSSQRPRTEFHNGYVVSYLRTPNKEPPYDSSQSTIVIGERYVLSFQEGQQDPFDAVRQRVDEGAKRIQEIGASYLGYALIDAIVDCYFPLLESYGELTESLEQSVISDPQPEDITDIHVHRRELLELRRALWSHREALNTLLRNEDDFLPDGVGMYLRDTADHCYQLLDVVETDREISRGLIDLHLSSASNQMNEVMKVLTVIATIFIPMTFISGLFGMNFNTKYPHNMPELDWSFGYYWALGLMGISAIVMILYFWRKGLIGKTLRKAKSK